MAVYQLITIRIDPFGAQHIITTPRCFGACVATWVIATGPMALTEYVPHKESLVILAVVPVAIVISLTGICYYLIFRAVARSHPGGIKQQDRQRENQKIFCTFGLVYGTTFISWCLIAIFKLTRKVISANRCSHLFLFVLEWMMFPLNWMANTLIYWWRLKEFRSVLFSVN